MSSPPDAALIKINVLGATPRRAGTPSSNIFLPMETSCFGAPPIGLRLAGVAVSGSNNRNANIAVGPWRIEQNSITFHVDMQDNRRCGYRMFRF
jgi:hypothetical protein